MLSPNLLRRIHPCVLWNFDSWYYNEQHLIEQAYAVDHFLTPSGGLVNKYKQFGIKAHYLPEAADPELHYHAQSEKDYWCDVVFIGTVKDVDGRAEWLKSIGERFNLKIWGSFPDPLIEKWHTGKRAQGDHIHNKVVASCLINLDRTRTPTIEGAISARVYRTLAAKGFLLMHHIEGIENHFKPRVDLDTFKTTDECLAKIAYYLLPANDEERVKIRESGYKLILDHHTWRHRISELLSIIRL